MLLDCGPISDVASTQGTKDGHMDNRVVFIGKNLDREYITSGFTSCIISQS